MIRPSRWLCSLCSCLADSTGLAQTDFFQWALKRCQVNILFQSALFVSPQATKQHTRGNPSGTESPSKSLQDTHTRHPAVDLRECSGVGEMFFSTLATAHSLFVTKSSWLCGFHYHALWNLTTVLLPHRCHLVSFMVSLIFFFKSKQDVQWHINMLLFSFTLQFLPRNSCQW